MTISIHYHFHLLPIDVYRLYTSAGWEPNSADPDQTLHSAASDLGLHCLLKNVCPNTWAKSFIYIYTLYAYASLHADCEIPSHGIYNVQTTCNQRRYDVVLLCISTWCFVRLEKTFPLSPSISRFTINCYIVTPLSFSLGENIKWKWPARVDMSFYKNSYQLM